MSMRQVSALSLAALFLAGAMGQAAANKSSTTAALAKAKCPPPNKSDKAKSHGSFCCGLNSQGFLVTIDCKPDPHLNKGKAFHAHFPVFGLSPFVARVLGTPVGVLTRWFMDVNGISVSDLRAETSSQATCPCVKNPTDAKQVQEAEGNYSDGSVLEKWEQLQQAKCMCHLADYYRRKGQGEKAVALYQQVQKLCPGSRYDARAATQIQQVKMQPVKSGDTTSEQEEQVSQRQQSTRPRPTGRAHAKRVDKLLTAAHQALLHKDYYRAEKLAGQALKLDPECVAAHPLVYKLQLLSQVQEHMMKSMPCVPTVPRKKARKKEQASTWAAPRPAPAKGWLHPALPAIDPQVAAALDKLLAEATDRAGRHLVVVVEVQGSSEEQEEPGSAGPAAGPQEMELIVETEEQMEGAANRQQTAPDLNEFLHELVNTLGGAVEIEIDTSREDGLRGKCALQVGGVDLELLWSDSDPAYATIRLMPEPKPDDQ